MPTPPTTGEILGGKYRVERVLGQGGMGVVVEATHVALGQRVAIKVLNPELILSREIVERFLLEAQIAAQLPSAHIARVSDVGVAENGAPFLVMELLVGNDLAAELLREKRLPIPTAIDYVLQAIEGLAEAHVVGMVHRDLKPANIFLCRKPGKQPLVKVLDFGLSKVPKGMSKLDSLTATNSTFGTPQYMSPEQLISTKKVDARCDQHALGMILFELMTGKPPYDADSVTKLMIVIATQPPPSARAVRGDVSEALDEVLKKAMAKDRERRFATVGELAAALAPFGTPGSAERLSAIQAIFAAGSEKKNSSDANLPGIGERTDKLLSNAVTRERTTAQSPASVAGFTSSVDPAKRARRARSRLVAAAAAGVAIAGGFLAVLATRGGAAPTQPTVTTTPATTAPLVSASPLAAPPASASAEPEVSPSAPAASVEVSPSAPAASVEVSPAPAPSASASAAPLRAPAAPPHVAPKKPGNNAIEVFGGKRR